MYVNCLGGPNFLVIIYVPEGFLSHRSMIGRVFLQPNPKVGMDFVTRILGESWCASSLCKNNLEIILTIWLGYYKFLDLLDYICVAELGGL